LSVIAGIGKLLLCLLHYSLYRAFQPVAREQHVARGDILYICLFPFRFYLMKMSIILKKKVVWFLFMETYITLPIHFVKMC